MQMIDRIIRILTYTPESNYNITEFSRSIVVNALNVLIGIGVLMLGIFDFISHQYIKAYIELLLTVIVVFNFIWFKRKRNNTITEWVLVFVTIVVSASQVFIPQTNNIIANISIGMLALVCIPSLGVRIGSLIFVPLWLIFVVYIFAVSSKLESHAILFAVSNPLLFLIAGILDYVSRKRDEKLLSLLKQTEEAYREKTEFISKLSHQIRTPLGNIIGVVSLINKTELDEKQQDIIETIQAAANNMSSVVDSINEAGNIKLDLSQSDDIPFNLHFAINATLDLFASNNNGQIKFHKNIAKEIPNKLIGNPIRVKQILLNIIEHFQKNRSNTPTLDIAIDVTLRKSDSFYIECEFELKTDKPLQLPFDDNAPLYSNNDLRISQIDVNIAKKLVELGGGRFDAQSNETHHIYTFSLNFKKTQERTKNTQDEGDTTSLQTPKLNLEEANVLLVEDNLINQKIMLLSLKKIVKNVDVANNGKEALDKFGTARYDMVLMDVQMPVMDGIKATIKIRELETNTGTHTPIIAITANALLGDREECLAAGMDDYISKPFQIKELIDKMRFHINRFYGQ